MFTFTSALVNVSLPMLGSETVEAISAYLCGPTVDLDFGSVGGGPVKIRQQLMIAGYEYTSQFITKLVGLSNLRKVSSFELSFVYVDTPYPLCVDRSC